MLDEQPRTSLLDAAQHRYARRQRRSGHCWACTSTAVRRSALKSIGRRIEDRGGGLALVDGRPRLVEGLAMPNERSGIRPDFLQLDDDVDRNRSVCSTAFGLTRNDLGDATRVDAAVRQMASRLPTYITLKDVKKRWGHAQEDVFPVAQFEKLWGDMTTLARGRLQFLRHANATRPTAQGPGPTGSLETRRQRRLHRIALQVVVASSRAGRLGTSRACIPRNQLSSSAIRFSSDSIRSLTASNRASS